MTGQQLRSTPQPFTLSHRTRQLVTRMLSPMVGLDQHIGFSLRGYREPRFVTAGAELTGVHVLRGREAPPTGFYHIGGGGIFLEEAVIRSLGESVERYSQFVSEVSDRQPVTMASYSDMERLAEPLIDASHLRFFTDAQHATPGFPFRPFDTETVLGWIRVPSLLRDERVWVPAQLLMVGYGPKVHDGENWLLASVTTGSAAHTEPRAAVLNALLELVQIDSAMGHWYSGQYARRIRIDDRVRPIEQIIKSRFHRHEPQPSFYWLSNPDLPGFAIACVMRGERGRWPAAAVGLGMDLELVDAMYKSLIEGVGVYQLTKWETMRLGGEADDRVGSIDPTAIYDLDTNVALYAHPSWRAVFDAKFVDAEEVAANDLLPDGPTGLGDQVRVLLKAFHDSGKDLLFMDLTTDDIADLGFTAVRVWSPDTLSLCLPSAPPIEHARFHAYGGPSHAGHPHPYP